MLRKTMCCVMLLNVLDIEIVYEHFIYFKDGLIKQRITLSFWLEW